MLAADEIALQMNHEFVGSEHLLLGILKYRQGIGAKALEKLGVEYRQVLAEVDEPNPIGPTSASIGRALPYSPNANAVIGHAIEEAQTRNHPGVGDEHLLLGITRQYECKARRLLKKRGLDMGKLRAEIALLFGEDRS